MSQPAKHLTVQDWIRRHPEALFFAAGGILRLLWLTLFSLWSDEALTLAINSAGFHNIIPLVQRLDSSPPLHPLLMHFWMMLISDPLIAMRTFSLLCGLASLAVFYRLCVEIVPADKTVAFLFGSFSPYWIHISQDGRCYALYLLVALLNIWTVVRLKDRWSNLLWLGYVLSGILGMYIHYYFLILIATNLAFLSYLAFTKKRSIIPVVLSHLVLLLAYVPWVSPLLVQMRLRGLHSALPAHFDFLRLSEIFGPMTSDMSQINLVFPQWLEAIGFFNLIMLAVSLFLLLRHNRKTALFFLTYLTLPLVFVKALEWITGVPLVQARYFAFLSPFVYWTIAMGLSRFKAPWRSVFRIGFETLMLAGLCGYYTSNHFSTNLSKVSESIRLSAPSSMPILYLDAFYYLSMRYYYLPDRSNYLLPGNQKDILDLQSLPGYSGLMLKSSLPSVGSCVVVDMSQRYMETKVGFSTGKVLSELLKNDAQ